VRQELAGKWDISIEPAGGSPLFHLHKIDNDTAEFHRKHPASEPRLMETDSAASVAEPTLPTGSRARLSRH
jgi:hypothetical protein